MIKEIERDDIPDIRERRKMSPARVFAEEQLDEFAASSGEACEVVDLPEMMDPQKVAAALRTAIHNRPETRGRVKIVTRKGRIFMERIAGNGRVVKMPASNPARARRS